MGLFNGIGSAIKGVADVIKTPIKSWMDIKEAEKNGKIAIQKAKVRSINKRAEKGQEIDAEWETAQIKNSGWKDEWVLLMFSVPSILCFIYPQAVLDGFEALDATPGWYQYVFVTIALASFGIRNGKKLVNKGSKMAAKLGGGK